jgi:hypothetical protein
VNAPSSPQPIIDRRIQPGVDLCIALPPRLPSYSTRRFECMDFTIPAEIQRKLEELDAFIEREIAPAR